MSGNDVTLIRAMDGKHYKETREKEIRELRAGQLAVKLLREGFERAFFELSKEADDPNIQILADRKLELDRLQEAGLTSTRKEDLAHAAAEVQLQEQMDCFLMELQRLEALRRQSKEEEDFFQVELHTYRIWELYHKFSLFNSVYANETASNDFGNSTSTETVELSEHGITFLTNAAYKGLKTFPDGEQLVDGSPLSQKNVGMTSCINDADDSELSDPYKWPENEDIPFADHHCEDILTSSEIINYAEETPTVDIENATEIEEYPEYGASSSTNAAYSIGFRSFAEGEQLVDISPFSQKNVGRTDCINDDDSELSDPYEWPKYEDCSSPDQHCENTLTSSAANREECINKFFNSHVIVSSANIEAHSRCKNNAFDDSSMLELIQVPSTETEWYECAEEST